MVQPLIVAAVLLAFVVALAAVVFTLRTVQWGATAAECAMAMPGDGYLIGEQRPTVVMTRAVTIQAGTETVWPWLPMSWMLLRSIPLQEAHARAGQL